MKVIKVISKYVGDIEKRLKLFFEAGVTPEFAEDPKDAERLNSMF